jgi:hypothetical protein
MFTIKLGSRGNKRGTHHEHPLLQVSPSNAFIIPSVLKDSSCGNVRCDCINRRFDCGVCGVIIGRANASGEVGQDELVDVEVEATRRIFRWKILK